jgi:GH15 family glucan-1,4-alpha-glucosidase
MSETPIEDYALLGDCHGAALVSLHGSIDWLCFPRFDASACFAALLGSSDHGRWQIRPQAEPRRVTRRYRDETWVLETRFETEQGSVLLIDCMVLGPTSAPPQLVRVVRGERGTVAMCMELVLRFDYGSSVPWVVREADCLSATA